MEDYTNSMAFAKALVQFVMKHQPVDISEEIKLTFVGKERDPAAPYSVESVGKSVLNLLLLQQSIIYDCYFDLTVKETYQDSEIGRLAMDSVPHFFPEGYTHCGFIAFCALAIGVSMYYLRFDDQFLPVYMIGIVGNVLVSFMLTGEFSRKGGWDGLGDVSKDFSACAKKIWDGVPDEKLNRIVFFALGKHVRREDLDP